MKKILSFILAALLLASAVTSCGKASPKETEKAEINAVETVSSETVSSDTPAPSLSYDANTVTENGIAKCHIVIFDGADALEQYASEELIYHIKLISGADVSVTNGVQEDSLPIIIATPDSYPELEELFPEDLAWLRDTGDGAKVRWCSDGFSIRQLDGKIYIFGVNAKGALNGVYDFIEDNMGVLWTRASNISYGLIYDEMPTITLSAVNYKEKSPFDIRGWALPLGGSFETEVTNSRNKLNCANGGGVSQLGYHYFSAGHNIQELIVSSPSYDPNCVEYWCTDINGKHATGPDDKEQVNFWSDITVQCIADSVIAQLDKNYSSIGVGDCYIGISLEDNENISVYPEMTQPYEYAPGQFVEPHEKNYLSTVYFDFLNKVSRIVRQKYPDVIIHTYTYLTTNVPPACELEDNIFMTYAPLHEDLLAPIGESGNINANHEYNNLLGWIARSSNIQVRNYYCCFRASPLYERPTWYRIQSDLQLYAENGFNGLLPEGVGDSSTTIWPAETGLLTEERLPYYTCSNAYAMNAMTYWIYAKLTWNPYEDVDALVKYYCDKAYGDASAYMQEYYRLLQIGWLDGGDTMSMEFNQFMHYYSDPSLYWDYFLDIDVDGVYIYDAIVEALHKAYDAANDVQKERLKHIVAVYDNAELLMTQQR